MAQTLNHRQACSSLYLSQFDYSLTHRASKHSAKPDALSRHVNHQVKGEDNEGQVMLPTECFASEPPGELAGTHWLSAYKLTAPEPSPPVSTLKLGAQILWTKSMAEPTETNESYVP